jgi:hypothetical protein
MPARQISHPQIANSNAHQLFHPKSKALEHPANLSIHSLLENDAQFRGPDLANMSCASAFAIENDPAQQLAREFWCGGTVQRHLVFFFDFETRVGQAFHKIAIVREQK